MVRRWAMLAGLLGVLLLLAGCPASSTGTLTYSGPTEQTVSVGERIPGSDIEYVGYGEAGAKVLIADQEATKKVGDSLDWSGSPVPGVQVVMAQRILAANAERLQTVGTVRVTVSDIKPAEAIFPDKPLFSYKVAVSYTVRKGALVPGTLLTFEGKAADGAEFKGVSGYPYRKLGDSLSWTGRLRSNTYVETTLRLIAYADDFVTLGGLATIGLTE